jgi:hypothetical protein
MHGINSMHDPFSIPNHEKDPFPAPSVDDDNDLFLLYKHPVLFLLWKK